jgi:membrane fusion protein (multidrug efflux system)
MLAQNKSRPTPPSENMSRLSTTSEARTTSLVGTIVRKGIPVLLLIGLLAGAYYYWGTVSHAPAPQHATPPQGPIDVKTVTVRAENFPAVMRFLGQTEGAQVVEIRARVAGYLQERTFTEGSRVEKGQKLFQIDPRPFEVEVRRYQQLGTQGTVTESEVEEWETQQRVAAAQVQVSKAEIAAAQLQLDYATISSPITGVIGQVLKDTGSYVDAGQNGLLAVVQQVDPIYVRYAVTEQEVLRFRRQVAEGELNAPEVEDLELEITLSDLSLSRQD